MMLLPVPFDDVDEMYGMVIHNNSNIAFVVANVSIMTSIIFVSLPVVVVVELGRVTFNVPSKAVMACA